MPKTTRIHGGIDASRVNDLQDAGIVDQTYPRFLRVAGRHRRHMAASTLGIGCGPCLAGKPPRRDLHRLSAPRVRVGPLLGGCDGVLVDSPTLLKPGQYRIKVATQLNRLMAEPFTYLDCLPRAFDQRFGVSGNFTVGSCHGYPLSLRVIVPAATRVCQFRPISDHC